MDTYRHINIHHIYDIGCRASSPDEELAAAFDVWAPLSTDFLRIIRAALKSYDELIARSWMPGNKLPVYELVIPPDL